MSVLFVHDHYFLRHHDTIYSNTFSYTILNRYIEVFSEVTVAARCRDLTKASGKPVASGKSIQFSFFDNLSTLRSFFGPRQRAKKRLRQLIQVHDGVIVRLPSELGMLAAEIAEELGKPLLVEVVGSAWGVIWHYGRWQGKLYAPFFSWRMARILRRSAWSAYVTDAFLQHHYPSKVHAVTAAISDVEIPMADPRVLERRQARIRSHEGKIVIGLIASLKVRYKGVETLLAALAQVKRSVENFECQIVGEGDSSFFIALARRYGVDTHVVFLGELEGEAGVSAWLDSIDIYVQPSLTEGLPRSLIEAMSRGCPAIGSAVGGIPELLDRAMTVPPKDVASLTEKMILLISDKTRILSEAERNLERAARFQKSVLDSKRKAFLTAFRDALMR